MLKNLRAWEEELRSQVVGGNILLGQLPLGSEPYDRDDMEDLGRLLSVHFQRSSSFHRRLERIQRRYPLSLALFLVLHGVYKYKKGIYWPSLMQQLGLVDGGNYGSAIGRAFREIIAQFNLPTFAHIQGHINLVPILAHGGIPNHSLGDFFRLLQRSTRENLIRVDAETLIEEWAANREEAFFWIDRPVQRFVLHGGAVAEDFVERCISLLYDEYTKNQAALGLPQRVVRGYQEWRNRDKESGKALPPQIRLRRPVLYLDPYGEGVSIELPPPFFPLGRGTSSLRWEIEAGKRSFEVSTDRRRVKNGYEYEAVQNLQVPVASSYKATLRTPTQVVRVWILAGLDKHQLLMFDPDTWTALKADEYKRPGERWILYPREGQLTVDGGRLTTQFPPQYGEWSPYRVEEWIIPGATTLELRLPGQERHQLQIVDELSLRRPHFVNGKKALHYHDNSRFPLYSGEPPSLCIAFAQKPVRKQLEQWHISIRSEGKARPADPVAHSLAELTDHLIHSEDGSVLLKLSAPQLLGPRPMGKFEIHAQGPFGQSRRLGLRLVPQLTVLGDNKLYLDQDNAEAELQLICHPNSRVRLRSHEEEVEVVSDAVAPNYYKIRAPAHVHSLKFAVKDEDGIGVPFTVRLRRLRWALREDENSEDLVWQASPLRIFPDALEDTYNAELYVELPPFSDDGQLYGGWCLIDGNGRVYAERPPDEEHARRQYAIPLPELMTEYRHSRSRGETLLLQIWVREQEGAALQHFVDAMYLLPTYQLEEVLWDWEEGGEGVYLKLNLKGPVHGRNRVLFLWPADAPWIERPREIAIPDESTNNYRLFVPEIYGSGHYHGAFLAAIEVKNPWVTQTPERPATEQSNAFTISPPHAEQYYAGLQAAVDAGNASAEQMLVLLHYYYRHGASDEMHRINHQLRQAAKQERLPVEQLVLWAELTEALDRTAYKLVQRYTLFTTETIDALRQKHLSESWQQRYFAHLPNDFMRQADIYEHLLLARFPEVRDKCIAGLCRQGRATGVEQLLNDVESGRLLVREAVEYLLPAAEKVAPQLVQKETEDAATLLWLLAARTTAPITWLQPGLWLRTDIGEGEVEALTATETGQPVVCCDLNEPILVRVSRDAERGRPPFLLDLEARLVMIEADSVYQCTCCRYVFESHDHVAHHYRKSHPYENLRFRQLTGESTIMAIQTLAVQYRQ